MTVSVVVARQIDPKFTSMVQVLQPNFEEALCELYLKTHRKFDISNYTQIQSTDGGFTWTVSPENGS